MKEETNEIQKEKVVLVYCDVIGTYTSKEKETRKIEVNKFVENINELTSKYGSKKVVFSFITSCTKEEITKYVLELKNEINVYPNCKIELGEQYCIKDNHFCILDANLSELSDSVDTAKASQIMSSIIKHERENKEEIKKVYYIDDDFISTEITEHLYKAKIGRNGIIIINPEQNGLVEVNEKLSGIIMGAYHSDRTLKKLK